MANPFDVVLVELGNPTAYADNEQAADDLRFTAKRLRDEGKITEEKYQGYLLKIADSSINATINNSEALGLGVSPSATFVDAVKEQSAMIGGGLQSFGKALVVALVAAAIIYLVTLYFSLRR
jgi:hypothetical protein